MNTLNYKYARLPRRWFIYLSIGVHVLALGLLVWWLVPGPTQTVEQPTPSLSVILAPAQTKPEPSVTQPQPPSETLVATQKPESTKKSVVVAGSPAKTEQPVTAPTNHQAQALTTEPTSSVTYYQLLMSSRALLARELASFTPSRSERLSALLNTPSIDRTLVGQLQSERHWAGSDETLVVFDTLFGNFCARYTDANPLDSLDRGKWRMLIGGCTGG
jgi:cytoskeletal protein RodZ